MIKEKYEEFVKKLEIPYNQWIILEEIDAIVLRDGTGIYPDWKHLRFLFKESGDILIRHGFTEPYGDRLNTRYSISIDKTCISFPANMVNYPGSYKPFRLPMRGDIIRFTDGTKVYAESIISDVKSGFNSFMIATTTPMEAPQSAKLSFYDPTQYTADCMHSSVVEGLYMKFIPNDTGRLNTNIGIYQDTVKIKEIKEIKLKLSSKHYKTFSLNY